MTSHVHPDRVKHFARTSQPTSGVTISSLPIVTVPTTHSLSPGNLNTVTYKPIRTVDSVCDGLEDETQSTVLCPPRWIGNFAVSRVNADPFKISDKNVLLDCHDTDDDSAEKASFPGGLYPLSMVMSQEMYALQVGDTFKLSLFVLAQRTADETALLRSQVQHQYGQWGELIEIRRIAHPVKNSNMNVRHHDDTNSTDQVANADGNHNDHQDSHDQVINALVHLIFSFGGHTCSLLIDETPELNIFQSYPPHVYLAMNIDDFRSKLARLQKMS